MQNPRKIYAKKDEQLFIFHGRVFKVTDRTTYASVTFAEDESSDEVKYTSVMCFGNNGGIGVDHRSIAVQAESIRQSLTGNDIMYATIVAVKQTSPDGKVNYKARSTSFCVSEKGKYFTSKNPERVYFKPEQFENVRIMSGFVTGIFPNAKFNALSFRADTNDKDAGFVSVRCFAPYDETKARINNLNNSYAIAEKVADGKSVHCIVTCLASEYEGKTYYNAITTFFAERKSK